MKERENIIIVKLINIEIVNQKSITQLLLNIIFAVSFRSASIIIKIIIFDALLRIAKLF